MTLNVLILGVNGFIGSHLSEIILARTDWRVYGMDMRSDKIAGALGDPRFHFVEGDITINREWVEYHVKKCDVVLPLVAIATPASYVKEPLRVFELDFEANLRIVRDCVRYGRRVVFPSTSEVYGKNPAAEFDEETSDLVLGPIAKQRWIYSCSKQLLDRVIYAYGFENKLDYTLFRPFNWIGPRLDNIHSPLEGSSRVLTQFAGNILRRSDIHLVGGGRQRRCFLYVGDAMEALLKIVANRDGVASKRIFNIGNPATDVSIRELAELMIRLVAEYPGHEDVKKSVRIVETTAREYYGAGYEDIQTRVPSVKAAEKFLDWRPSTDLETAIRKTLDHYLPGRGDMADLSETAN